MNYILFVNYILQRILPCQNSPTIVDFSKIIRTLVGMAELSGCRLEWQDYPDAGWNGRITRMTVGMAENHETE